MASLVFVDTEFTSLPDFRQPMDKLSHGIGLISFGLVSATGQSLYLELADGWKESQCNDFCREMVLPNLSGDAALDSRAAAERLYDFLAQYPDFCLVGDSEMDWLLLDRLLGKKWPFGRQEYRMAPVDHPAYVKAFDSAFDIILNPQHHALHDACAIQKGWEAVHG